MRLPPLLLPLLLAACGTSRLPLPYVPPAAGVQARGPAVVASVTAIDRRGESAADANWVGSIRGGFGNPLKRLESDRPLTEVVADDVRAALRARGLLGGADAPDAVRVDIETLNSDQVVRREARVRLRFAWSRDGAPGFTNTGESDVIHGSVVTLETGVFGSVESLRATTAEAISQAIDRALDDPALAAFLARGLAAPRDSMPAG